MILNHRFFTDLSVAALAQPREDTGVRHRCGHPGALVAGRIRRVSLRYGGGHVNLRQLHCARLIPAVVAVVLAASVALPGQAAAADGRRVAGVVDRLARAADPVAAYAELPLEDQAAVRQFLTAVSVSDISTLSVEPSTRGDAVVTSIICW